MALIPDDGSMASRAAPNGVICARPPGRLLVVGPACAALIWGARILIAWFARRPASGSTWLRAARADDDQQVRVDPADLGAGQAGQEDRDRAQLLRGVEGECRVGRPSAWAWSRSAVLERGWLKVWVATTASPPVRLTASRIAAWLCSRCSCSVKPGK